MWGSSASSWQITAHRHDVLCGFLNDPTGLSWRRGDPRGALTSSLGQKYPPSAAYSPTTFAKKGGCPKPPKVPCRCCAEAALFSASKPGAGPKDRHFGSKCTKAKPGKAMGQKGQARGWMGGQQSLFPKYRWSGTSHFQNVVFI